MFYLPEIMFSFHPTHIITYLVTSPLTLQQFNYQDTPHVYSIRLLPVGTNMESMHCRLKRK